MFFDIYWIFFDLGSTLVDERQACRRRIEAAIEDTGISYEQFCQTMLRFYRQNKKGDQEAFAFYGLPKPEWPSREERLYPEAVSCLHRLKRCYRLGIIANQLPGVFNRLEQWGILRYFSVIVTSDGLGAAKPDLQIFRAALQQAGCPAHRCVMIGDRLDNDIAPAKSLGMKTVWVRQGFAAYSTPRNASEQADAVVDGIEQVADLFEV